MADALELLLDEAAAESVRSLRESLVRAGVPTPGGRPHVTLAVAGSIPAAARRALRSELSVLAVPQLWLYTLGTFPDPDNVLLLAAVVDTEVLALHSAVHDVLAGRVRGPSAHYLPGAWIPHCTLARGLTSEQLATGFAALHPVDPVRAHISDVAVVDTRTGRYESLRDPSASA
ncbi:2'-5' RNA ligase family protein [Bounagaea algeriensis]